MKKTLIGLAAGTALSVSAGTALADGYAYGSVKDLPPVDCCQANWNGLYIGAAAGYGIASTELDLKAVEDYEGMETFNIFNLDGISSKGFQGVISLGYDRQVHPGFVIGVFGDYSFGDLETDASLLEFARLDAEITDSWAVGARLGLVRSCCTMWFVTAGYAQADLDWRVSSEWESISGGTSLAGWFVGGGVEQQMRDNLFLKLEYRYTDYDSERLFSIGDEYERLDLDSQTEVHSVRLGVNWKVDLFHGRQAPPPPLK
ncbi:MAG: outer membrane beta-barrel protein [Hyphomicrobiaceae bacterium]|nr:outer membrane beta-barrel protein [Hyphomicrobiaceae bacterium]